MFQYQKDGSYQLRGKADKWWTTWRSSRAFDSPPVMWEEFKLVFIERFIPRSMRVARDREFELLKQRSMTVDEYNTKFI